MDKKAIKWIQKSLGSLTLPVMGLTLANALVAVMALLFALACRSVLDGASQGAVAALWQRALVLLGVVVAYLLLRLGCNLLTEVLRARLGMRLQDILLQGLFAKDYPGISGYHSGELMNHLFSDVPVVVDGALGIPPTLVNLGVRLVGAIGLLVWLGQWPVLIFLAGGFVIIGVFTLLRRHFKDYHLKAQVAEDGLRSFFQEAVENILAIKCFGIAEKMAAEGSAYQRVYVRAHLKRRGLSVAAGLAMDFLFNTGYCFALVVGSLGVLKGWPGMSYGTMLAVLQLVGQIQSPLAGLSGLLPRYYTTIASAERLMALSAISEEISAVEGPEPLALKAVVLSRLSFGYPGKASLLKAVDLRVNPGDRIALTGASGGGKTTLFLLMMGVFLPQKGHVGFETDEGWLDAGPRTRGLPAWVPQGNFLLSGTLRRNLCLLCGEVSEKVLWGALETACADAFVHRLPLGMNTVVGERGVGLSEGQIQRIAIARAVLSDAPVLLLDEATSALDEETEAAVLRNLQGLGRTCVIVTHRPAALAICNRRVRLENGRLWENE